MALKEYKVIDVLDSDNQDRTYRLLSVVRAYLHRMQDAYNDLDEEGKPEWDDWLKKYGIIVKGSKIMIDKEVLSLCMLETGETV